MIHNSHRNPDNDQNLCPTFPKNFAETFHTMGIILHAMKRPQIINISSDVIEYAQQKLLTHTSTPTHCLTGHGRCKLVLADLPLYVNLHRSLSYAWLLLYWLIGQEHFHGSALPCGSKAGSLPRQWRRPWLQNSIVPSQANNTVLQARCQANQGSKLNTEWAIKNHPATCQLIMSSKSNVHLKGITPVEI